jgi:uncharacterized protein
MATITLRIDDPTRDQLQSMADGQGVSLSELLRLAIDGLFDRDDRESPRRSVVPESLSAVDRRQLALLHRILARLVEDQTEDERLGHDGDTNYQLDRAEALEEGWTIEYDTEFYGMEPELSRRDCGLVMDILDMFRVMKHSIEATTAPIPEETATMLSFSGFDLNDDFESRLLGYARSLIADGKWQELTDVFSDKNDRGNSHAPLLGAYRRMLGAYEPIWQSIVRRDGRKGYLLTVGELQQVADAAVHPENRARRAGR